MVAAHAKGMYFFWFEWDRHIQYCEGVYDFQVNDLVSAT